jgi:ornithine carbamoyltransferase
MMSITACGKARYLHCLPADISGVSCESGEVSEEVFDKHRMSLYKQASYKPYVIAAMIFLSKVKDPVKGLQELARRGVKRALL